HECRKAGRRELTTRSMASQRNNVKSRFEPIHAAERRGSADAPTEVRPELKNVRPAASDAVLPPEDPRGVRSTSHGLFDRPEMSLNDCPSISVHGTFVAPRRIAPLSSSL